MRIYHAKFYSNQNDHHVPASEAFQRLVDEIFNRGEGKREFIIRNVVSRLVREGKVEEAEAVQEIARKAKVEAIEKQFHNNAQ